MERNINVISRSRICMISEGTMSDTEISSCQSNKREMDDLDIPQLRCKGFLGQKNDSQETHSGNHNLHLRQGNFKMHSEAAKVSDAAATKVKSDDPFYNFSATDVTVQESVFQSLHSVEEISSMMKDGSYQSKLHDFITFQLTEGSETRDMLNEREILCQELFRKELTASDVSGLNRLVIPKRYAVAHFPPLRNNHIRGNANKRQGIGIQISLQDKCLKTWNFGYCYWKSSDSFVITNGWKEFVKAAKLKPKDAVIFYGSQEGRMASIIGLECNSDGISGGSVGSHVGLQPDLQCDVKDKTDEDESEGKEIKMGFKLFGVEI